jgi:hypothetical protein
MLAGSYNSSRGPIDERRTGNSGLRSNRAAAYRVSINVSTTLDIRNRHLRLQPLQSSRFPPENSFAFAFEAPLSFVA